MVCLTEWVPSALASAFARERVEFDEKPNHIIAKTSLEITDEKIKLIISAAGFYPLFSSCVREGGFAFTIVPYQVPAFFFHLSKDEIAELLESKKFLGEISLIPPKDRWKTVNYAREPLLPSLNRGVNDLVLAKMKEGLPVVEIGSGIGYNLEERVSSQTIRTQIDSDECSLLKNSISDSVYQVNIEELCDAVKGIGKTIPFLFSINTFDAMFAEERRLNLWRISKVQSSGDSMLFMLDTNPCINTVVREMEGLNRGRFAIPYLPEECAHNKISFIMAPISKRFDSIRLATIIDEEGKHMEKGEISPRMDYLRKTNKETPCPMVVLEDFFAAQLRSDLEELGYKVSVYYHISFIAADFPKESEGLKHELLYKPISDFIFDKKCALDDEALLSLLRIKGIKLPDHFDKGSHQRVLGVEILVIEAIKV